MNAATAVVDLASGRRCANFLGINPREFSSGEHRHLGRISRRGDRYIRMPLVARGTLRVAPGHGRQTHGTPRG